MNRAHLFTISSPASPDRLAAGLQAATQAGYRLSEPPETIHTPGYLAGDDGQRAESLAAAIADKDADFAWAVRGGYGAARTPLPPPELLATAGPIVGFSDLTFLLARVHGAGGQAVHGPVLTSFADADEASRRDLEKALQRQPRHWQLSPQDNNCQAGEGPLIGGNMAVLGTLLGTEDCPSFAGHYVVLEDVGEAHYRLDRLLDHLCRASDLAQAKGVLVGDFIDCPQGAQDLITQLLGQRGIPCWSHAPVGHGSRNQAFIWGEQVELDESGSLILHGR